MYKVLSSIYHACLLLCFFSVNPLGAVWSPDTTISPPSSDKAQIGIDGAGNAIAIWRMFDGFNTNIQSAILPKGGSWSDAATISSYSGYHTQCYPQIAVNCEGSAIAIWEECKGAESTVRATILPSDGEWSSPMDISKPSLKPGQVPQIAINSSGYAVAVWKNYDGSRNMTEAATFQFGGNWSQPVAISSSIDTYVPQIAVESSGNAVAVWLDVTNQTIQSATLSFGKTWGLPINLSAGGSGNPQIQMNPSGYAVAIWERFVDSCFAVEASTFQFGESWSAPIVVSTPESDAFQPDVAIDSDGNIIAVFGQCSGSDIYVQAAQLPFGGSWTSPSTLSPAGAFSFDPNVVIDGFGNAYAVWDRDNGYDVVVQTSILPFGGEWSAPVDLSAYGQGAIFPKIAVDMTGYAVVDWTSNTMDVIQAAAWISAPTITNVDPNAGSTSGGDSITIKGTNFINVTSVSFGSTGASFAVISPTEIIATSPAGVPGVVDITVITTAGTSSISPNDQYTYQPLGSPPPAVANVYPNNGLSIGGNPVRITGTNFDDVTQVSFGGNEALSFSVISSTLIIATVPAGNPGPVDVTVTTNAGTSVTNSRDHYTYR